VALGAGEFVAARLRAAAEVAALGFFVELLTCPG
jgi:hypothetical protein